MSRWKGFAGILLYRHIKAFITYNGDMGPKRIQFCLLSRDLLEAPVEVGAPSPALRRLDPNEEEELVHVGSRAAWDRVGWGSSITGVKCRY
jgi:hypothetical protein